MLLRPGRVLLAAFVALSLFVLLNGTLAVSAMALPAASPAQPPAHLPALTAADTFSATAVLTFSAGSVTMGDAFTVTAALVTTGTCRFALYDVTLRQSDPLFTYVAPPGSVIGPPGENPAIWRLVATDTGVTTFTVEFYGETNCDGVWQWTTVRSGSQPVAVTGARSFLPLVSWQMLPPLPPAIKDLGTLGGKSAYATGINNNSQVIGVSDTTSGAQHAFLWQNGVMIDLGALTPRGNSRAVAINERGQVIGNSFQGDTSRGFIWANGVMTDLGSLGGISTQAFDINNSGQVIGNSYWEGSSSRGFIWSSGVMTDLETLGGNFASVADINDRGQIVGYSNTADGVRYAFLWENGVMTSIIQTDFGQSGYEAGNGIAINDRGQVVGTYATADGASHGFLWQDGTLTDISSPASRSWRVINLNDRGQVVGYRKLDGWWRAFLWVDDVVTDLDCRREPNIVHFIPINETGMVLLHCVFSNPDGIAYLQDVVWRRGYQIPLHGLRSGLYAGASDINDRGQIVGGSIIGEDKEHAVMWEAGE